MKNAYKKLKSRKKTKKPFFLMYQESINPKTKFLGQKVSSVVHKRTDRHTDRQTDRQTHTKVTNVGTISRF